MINFFAQLLMVDGQSGESVARHVAEELKEELVQIQRHKMVDNTAKEII